MRTTMTPNCLLQLFYVLEYLQFLRLSIVVNLLCEQQTELERKVYCTLYSELNLSISPQF